MILVSYDGSADAQAAINRAAQLMPVAEATVLMVWEPFLEMLARGGYVDCEKIDEANREAASIIAAEGAERATAAGLVAQPRSDRLHGNVADTILDAAAETDADLIVMGTRGRSAVKSFLLGSVSHAVVQHADRAVLVVPSPLLAERRRDEVTRHAALA